MASKDGEDGAALDAFDFMNFTTHDENQWFHEFENLGDSLV